MELHQLEYLVAVVEEGTFTAGARRVHVSQSGVSAQIAKLERLRDRLEGCIGCGCLSLQVCRIVNPGDVVAARGPGPRYVLDPDDDGQS